VKLKRKEDLIRLLLPFYKDDGDAEVPLEEKGLEKERDRLGVEEKEKRDVSESCEVEVAQSESPCLKRKGGPSLSREFESCLLEGKRVRRKKKFFDDED